MNTRTGLLRLARALGVVAVVGAADLRVVPVEAAAPTPEAWERLETLGRLLARRAATNEEILPALDGVTATYAELRAASAGDAEPEEVRRERDRFLQRAEEQVVSALAAKRVPRGSDQNDRHPVQVRAARALGLLRPVAGARAMQVLARDVFKDRDYARLPTFYEAAFSSLVRMGARGVFDWLREEAVTADTDADSAMRTLAALRAMTSVREIDAKQRYEAMRRFIAQFQLFDMVGIDDYSELAGLRGSKRGFAPLTQYWIEVRPTLLQALRRFCTDPRTLAPPSDPDDGGELVSIQRYMIWFSAHIWKERIPPWVDGPPPATDRAGSRAEGRVRPPTLHPTWRKYGVPWEAWWRWTGDVEETPPASATTAEKAPAPVPAFLETLRKQTLPTYLRASLASPEAELRAVACMTLGKLGGDGVAKLLHARLAEDVSERVREAACLGLLLLRDPGEREPLLRLVDDPEESPRVRGTAVLALGFLGEAGALRERFAADRPKSGARKAPTDDLLACSCVARAIAREPGLASELLDLVRREKASDEVRGAAGSALARIADAKALPDLLRILEDTRRREVTQVAQVAAARALGTSLTAGDAGAWKSLRALLQAARGRFAHVRDLEFLAVGRAGGTPARDVLLEAYDACMADTQRPADRGYVLLGLGLVGTPEARSDLRARFRELDHERDAAACAVASAISKDALAVGPIRERLVLSTHEFTAYGIEALGVLGDAQAVAPIRGILERRTDPGVLTSSARALARLLGDEAAGDLRTLWDRCVLAEEHDAVAWAFRHAAGPKTVRVLVEIYSDGGRPAIERAIALAGLGRIADPEPVPLLRTFGLHFDPYGDSATLSSLATYVDVPFLH